MFACFSILACLAGQFVAFFVGFSIFVCLLDCLVCNFHLIFLSYTFKILYFKLPVLKMRHLEKKKNPTSITKYLIMMQNLSPQKIEYLHPSHARDLQMSFLKSRFSDKSIARFLISETTRSIYFIQRFKRRQMRIQNDTSQAPYNVLKIKRKV